jgi:hypothetical protein
MSLASCHGKFASLYFGMLSFIMVWFARSRIYRGARICMSGIAGCSLGREFF